MHPYLTMHLDTVHRWVWTRRGASAPRQAVRWWMSSPPHCRALLDPDATVAGLAVDDDPFTSGRVWVVVLGRTAPR